MYRFLVRPKWIAFTLLVVAAVVTMVNLGFWQLRRLDERRTFNTLVEARTGAVPVAIGELIGQPVADREWRTVTLAGAYRGPTEQVPTAGGYLLVTPFGIDGGDTVYVDRGFVGSAADVPDAPGGAVALTARFRGIPGAAESVPDGAAYLDRIESTPDEPDVTARPLPALDEGPHLSYAFQWFIFSGCVVVGWVLAVRRSARPRSTPPDGSPATKQEADRTARRRRQQAVPWQDADPAASKPSASKQSRAL